MMNNNQKGWNAAFSLLTYHNSRPNENGKKWEKRLFCLCVGETSQWTKYSLENRK